MLIYNIPKDKIVRRGDLYKAGSLMKLYPCYRDEDHQQVKVLGVGEYFILIDPNPDERRGTLPQYYDLHRPWLILYNESLWYIDIQNKFMWFVETQNPNISKNNHHFSKQKP